MTGEALKLKLSPWGKTAAEWADLLGVSDKTIYRMYKTNDVRTETVERLCMALNLPITFLYYADDSGKGAPRRKPQALERAFNLDKKVRDLMTEQHNKMGDLARHMGVSYSTVARMCANNSCSLASLTKIADFFNVPVTYFLPNDQRIMEEEEKDRQIHFLKGQLEAYKTTIATLLSNKEERETLLPNTINLLP